jgi:hypothetical protein
MVQSGFFRKITYPDIAMHWQLPCELHHLIEISHSLKIGIVELIPALAYVDIHSDAHFADLCKLNDQEKDDSFTL